MLFLKFTPFLPVDAINGKCGTKPWLATPARGWKRLIKCDTGALISLSVFKDLQEAISYFLLLMAVHIRLPKVLEPQYD